jgi:hypothetical protein
MARLGVRSYPGAKIPCQAQKLEAFRRRFFLPRQLHQCSDVETVETLLARVCRLFSSIRRHKSLGSRMHGHTIAIDFRAFRA